MFENEIQPDALLLRDVRNFSTANDNAGGNKAATAMTTPPATAQQRAGNIIDTA
jgi:hypothetical protein